MWNLKTLVQFQIGGMSPTVFQKMDKNSLRVVTLVAEDAIVVMTVVSQTGNSKSIFLGSQFTSLVL